MDTTYLNHPTLPGIADAAPEEASPPSLLARQLAEATLMARAERKLVSADPSTCVVWAYSTRDLEKLNDAELQPLMDSIKANGQQVAARGRKKDGVIEIIAGAKRLEAIRRLNASGYAVPLLVELVDMSDDAALRFAHAENEARSDLKPIERARFYERAIEHQYGNGKACADAFGVHKSTISRALDVLRVVEVLGGKIDDPRGISMAQASWLMGQLRERDKEADPTDRGSDADGSTEALAAIADVAPGSAADVFRALRDTLEPAHAGGDIDIVVDDDQIVGAVRARKSGAVRLDLAPKAGEVELPALIAAIKVAMAKLRVG